MAGSKLIGGSCLAVLLASVLAGPSNAQDGEAPAAKKKKAAAKKSARGAANQQKNGQGPADPAQRAKVAARKEAVASVNRTMFLMKTNAGVYQRSASATFRALGNNKEYVDHVSAGAEEAQKLAHALEFFKASEQSLNETAQRLHAHLNAAIAIVRTNREYEFEQKMMSAAKRSLDGAYNLGEGKTVSDADREKDRKADKIDVADAAPVMDEASGLPKFGVPRRGGAPREGRTNAVRPPAAAQPPDDDARLGQIRERLMQVAPSTLTQAPTQRDLGDPVKVASINADYLSNLLNRNDLPDPSKRGRGGFLDLPRNKGLKKSIVSAGEDARAIAEMIEKGGDDPKLVARFHESMKQAHGVLSKHPDGDKIALEIRLHVERIKEEFNQPGLPALNDPAP